MSGTTLRRLVASACLPFARRRPGAQGIRILMYHRIVPTAQPDVLAVHPRRFADQMAWLRQHRRVMSLAAATEELRTGVDRGPATVITFDDGYLDTLFEAVPVLLRHRLPATIFVTTDFLDGGRHPRYRKERGRVHFDWTELRQLAALPGIDIGSHTVTHPYLTQLDAVAMQRELVDSKARLEQALGRPVHSLCYPSGDFGARERSAAQLAGYRMAVTVVPGANSPGVDLLALRRTEINDKDEIIDLRLKLAGAFDPMHALLHRRRVQRFARAASDAEGQTAEGSA